MKMKIYTIPLFVLLIANSTSYIYAQNTSPYWSIAGNSNATATSILGTTNNIPLRLFTNNAERLHINANVSGKVGYVGIGTTAPAQRLHVSGKGTFTDHLGVGITAPAARLHVKGSTNVSQLLIDASATQSNSQPLIRLRRSNNTDLVHIHSDDPSNIFIGLNSGKMNIASSSGLDALNNTFIGYNAGTANTYGWLNTAVGSEALSSNTTGSSNTAIGVSSMQYNTQGYGNTAIGYRTLHANSTGIYNTALGFQALFYNNGIRNTAMGYEVLLNNNSGQYNTAAGFYCMNKNTTGSINSAYGHLAMYNNTTGNWNTAMGHQALYANNGTANTAIGLNALYNNTSGGNNTVVGKDAMMNNTTGHFNTIVGHNAGCSSGTPGNSNFIALGYNAGYVGSNANSVEIGNTSMNWIGGMVNWFSYFSDRRVKENVQSNVPGLEFISKLNPVTFNISLRKQYEISGNADTNEWAGKYDIEQVVQSGFIAQEIEEAAKACNYDFDGVKAPAGNRKLYSVSYATFVVPLVKAVQELNSTNEELKMQNAELLKKIEQIHSVLSEEQRQLLTGKTEAPILEQNKPNPFNERTAIRYYLPVNSSGELKIISLDGKEVHSEKINKAGHGEIIISARTLSAGTYTYTLIADGRAVESKLMVLTD